MKNITFKFVLLLMLVQIGCTDHSTKSKVTDTPLDVPVLSSFEAYKTTNENRRSLLISHNFGTTWEDASYDLPPNIQVSFLERKRNRNSDGNR